MNFFFFKQKTAYEMRISDCSSDVCSSDLVGEADARFAARLRQHGGDAPILVIDAHEARREAALPFVVGLDRRARPRPALAGVGADEAGAKRLCHRLLDQTGRVVWKESGRLQR